MKFSFIIFALAIASINLFGKQGSMIDQPRVAARSKMPAIENGPVADIIVIGGGAAGGILMSELSKRCVFSVLGLKAGPNSTTNPAIEAVGLPAFMLPVPANYGFFWPGFGQTEPQPTLNGRIAADWTTGLMLGGGSSVGELYYGRGSNAVYSQWQEVSGSDNWSLDKILETFNSLENYEGLTAGPNERGENGEVNVLQTPTVSQITFNTLLPAAEAAFPGIPIAVDYNAPGTQNCIDPRAQWLINPIDVKRVSSATAFLNSKVMTPAGHGANDHKLRVIFEAEVVKIVFDRHGRANAVRYVKNGRIFSATARKAVVLAGGINSSKILQLSGIGPKQTLENAGIRPVFVNENVGKHLQNHPRMSITLTVDPADNGIPPGAPYAYTIQNVYLPAVGGSADDPRMLQILFTFIPAGVQGADALLEIRFLLVNPKSEGSVEIQSNNSSQIAAVDPGFYQDSADLQNMKDAVENYIRALLEQLATIDPPYYQPISGDPINAVILSGYNDTVVESYVRNFTNPDGADARHFTSHCKMAPPDEGVVDGNTRVYGTTNCYVMDSSICPVIPDVDTAAAAMMIGLRGSEILKRVFRKR